MLSDKRIKEAISNVRRYFEEGLLKKERNLTSQMMYLENSALSIETSNKLLSIESPTFKPYLWIIVTSYYSMFYISNAVLLNLGYKVGDKISHKVTNDALIVFVRDKLKKKLIEEHEGTNEGVSIKVDSLISSFGAERKNRSGFQYEMDNVAKRERALSSLKNAKEFLFEMKRLLD